MSVNSFTTAYSQVQIGDPVDAGPIEKGRAAVLSAASSDAIQAGYGVDLASGAILGYKPLIQRPASATGEFRGIVPRAAIPTDEEAALRGSTADQLYPGQCLEVYAKGKWRVPITENVTALGDVYLKYSGSDAGKFAASSGGVSEIQTLTFANGGAGTASGNFDGLLELTFADLGSNNANAAQWAALFNASADYAALGSANAVGAVVTVTFTDFVAHTFTDNSTTITITDAQTQAPVAPTARLIEGAKWAVTTTGASGAGVVDLGQ